MIQRFGHQPPFDVRPESIPVWVFEARVTWLSHGVEDRRKRVRRATNRHGPEARRRAPGDDRATVGPGYAYVRPSVRYTHRTAIDERGLVRALAMIANVDARRQISAGVDVTADLGIATCEAPVVRDPGPWT